MVRLGLDWPCYRRCAAATFSTAFDTGADGTSADGTGTNGTTTPLTPAAAEMMYVMVSSWASGRCRPESTWWFDETALQDMTKLLETASASSAGARTGR